MSFFCSDTIKLTIFLAALCCKFA